MREQMIEGACTIDMGVVEREVAAYRRVILLGEASEMILLLEALELAGDDPEKLSALADAMEHLEGRLG